MFNSCFGKLKTTVLIGALLVFSTWGQLQALQTERPRAVDLLPERTVVFVQIDDLRDLTTQFWESGMGKMLQDEQVAPLATELYGEALAAYEGIQGEIGDFSLDQLQALPQGEICFAIVNPRRKDPGFVLLMDIDKESDTATELLAFLEEEAGAAVDTEDQEGITIHEFDTGDDEFFYVLHEGTFLACTDNNVLKEMVGRWQGASFETKPLSKNRKFTTIMRKCRSTEDLPMAASFFVDPIETYRAFTRGNMGARAALGFLPLLGLDGVLGVGGSVLYNEKGFESILHAHVLLANPRAGILKMIAMKPGMYHPEAFVPEDCASYMTSHWDRGTFLAELKKIVDGFGGEDTFEKGIEELSAQIEVDFQAEFIDNLEGRLTYYSFMLSPTVFNSQSHGGALRVEDPEQARAFISTVIEKAIDGEFEAEHTYEGITYWAESDDRIEDRAERRRQRLEDAGITDQADMPSYVRRPRPCVAVIDDYLVFCDSVEMLKASVDTYTGKTPSLAESDFYVETTDQMLTLLDTQLPSMSAFSRPDISLKFMFDLLKADATQDFMDQGAESNDSIADVVRVIQDNPLPEFEELAKYFPPNGGFVVDDESGLHLLFFQTKPVDLDD